MNELIKSSPPEINQVFVQALYKSHRITRALTEAYEQRYSETRITELVDERTRLLNINEEDAKDYAIAALVAHIRLAKSRYKMFVYPLGKVPEEDLGYLFDLKK